MNKIVKMGFNLPEKYRSEYMFSKITVVRDDKDWYDTEYLGLYKTTNEKFLYNKIEQERLLYYGKPCIYTDVNFKADDNTNFIFWDRNGKHSLKAFKRFVNKLTIIPKHVHFSFKTSYYFTKINKGLEYNYKTKSKNKIYNYEINKEKYFKLADLNVCNWDFNGLVTLLRNNGFTCAVYHELEDKYTNEHYYCVAYGFGKKIGFVSNQQTNSYYFNNFILWDKLGYFNKWSQCEQIELNTNFNTILEILKQDIGVDGYGE